MSKITIYTDGGCRGNQEDENVGGWGAILEYNGHTKELYGGERDTTNNKMELTGAIKALEALKTTHIPVEVYSDSKYVVENKNKYVDGWIKRGWKKSDKKPVLNKELWQRLVELSNKQDDIAFHWVKGHAKNEGNNRADELANIAMDEISEGDA